jgi:hypothetical protein
MRMTQIRNDSNGIVNICCPIISSSQPSVKSTIRAINPSVLKFFTILFLLAQIASCSSSSQNTHIVTKAQLAAGTYKVSYGFNYAAADEQKILAITADLDRTGQQLVFTLQDGTKRALVFTPRDESQWKPDCYTMKSHVLCEVADLTPAPLQLESMTFDAPLVYAKCSPSRMILTSTLYEDPSLPFLVFDLSN